MAQAIDIDVDDANRLPTHWLHAAYAGADAPALIAARKAEVAGLFLGDATERGVRDACARGDQAYVARACGTLKSLGDLRVPIAAQERCDWARACVDGANVADAPVASSERLYDMAGRLLTAPTTGAEVELRAIPNLPSFADTLRRTLAALDAAPDVANRERLSARRRALATLACNQRRLSTWGDAEVSEICAELEATISQLGPKAQDSLAALLALKIAAPTPNERSPLPPGAAERWCRRWEEWSRDGGSVEADAVWLTLLCRARKDPAQAAVLRRPPVATRIIAELIRAAQAGVGAARGATPRYARAAAGRYRWLAYAGCDAPAERCLRKLAKLALYLVSTDDVGLESLARVCATLRPLYHPSNSGAWTSRLALLLSELSRECAKGAARRRAALKLPAGSRGVNGCVFEGSLPSRETTVKLAQLLAPLARAALYARHESMVLSAIGTLQNLSEAAPEVVADAIVPALGAALEEGSVLWAHQAPAALRCLAALVRPLFLRRRFFEDVELHVADSERFCREAFFDGRPKPGCRNDGSIVLMDPADAINAPLAGLLPNLLQAALDAVDPNDDAKTRCAFLFVDCVLRWLPLRDDDDTPFENAALDDVALRLGRDWAPRFLDRVFAVVDARDEKAHVPNQGAGRRHNAVLNQREDASAGLLRTVARRLLARMAPRLRAASQKRIGAYALNAESVAAKDAAGLCAAAVDCDPACTTAATTRLVETLFQRCLEALKDGDRMRAALAVRCVGGACRRLAPAQVARRLADIETMLDMSLAHGDKVVRRCGRKLLRDALRGLVETRCATSGVRDWPASGFGDVKDAAVAWRGPPAGDDLERTAAAVAGLIRRRAQEPLQKLIKEGGNRRAWLDGLRQFARGARGASAALTDGTEPLEVLGDAASPLSMQARGVDAVTAALGAGNRIVLTELLTAAMATISRDDKLARDAKVLRAAAKAARVLLCLRRSAHMGRSAQVLASVRAWRRHGTTDIMADYELSLVVGDDERMRRLYARRGADDAAERAAAHHLAWCLRSARNDAAVLKEGGRAAEAHDQLIGAVVRLTAHDYTDVRSACSEAIEWCWFYYAWALKPRLAPALREISGEPGALFAYKYEGPRPAAKRSSELFAAVAFAGSRRALRHVAGDPGLGELVCRAVCRKERGDLDQIDDDQKDDVAARFDGLWLWYALRYSIRPSNAEALVALARRGAQDATLHWRHRLVADVVLGHALAARDQDDGDDETWQYVAQGATDPQDAPTQRARLAVALRFSDRAARGGANKAPLALVTRVFAADGTALDPLHGLLDALCREHRRERARDQENGASARDSPVVEALLKQARHSEGSRLFPKATAPYASRGFRSRHARFVKRLCLAAAEVLGGDPAAAVATASTQLFDRAAPPDRGAAAAAAAEVRFAASFRIPSRSSSPHRPGAARCERRYERTPTRRTRSSSRCGARCASCRRTTRRPGPTRCATPSPGSARGPLPGRGSARRSRASGGGASTSARRRRRPCRRRRRRRRRPRRRTGARPAVPGPSRPSGSSWRRPCSRSWGTAATTRPGARPSPSPTGCARRCWTRRGTTSRPCATASARAWPRVTPWGAASFLLLLFTPVRHAPSARTWLISPHTQVREAPEDVQRLAAMLDDADEDAKRRKRETAYGLLRHASRAGKVSIVAPLVDAAIDGCADAKQDHQALAAQSVGTLMASPALRLDAAPILGDRLMRGASHAKWRSRRAAAAALGAYAAARACLGDATECTKVAQALSALLGDDTSEVRDAATGSFSVMAVIAAPAQRDAFCQAQLDRAKAALPLRRPPKRKKTAVVDVSGAQRLGAVTALGACVLAYPYDVPAHVPASLVALARHSHTTSSSNGGARHAAAVREAVRATFAEFKRTHAETWDFVRPLFSSEELDALADILSAGDYLV